MNYLEHEYLVPIFLGNDKRHLEYAKALRRINRAQAHVFASRFNPLLDFRFVCHKVSPWRDRILLISLIDFVEELEEYKHPVLIYNEDEMNFISSNLEELESRLRVVSFDDVVRILEEKNEL